MTRQATRISLLVATALGSSADALWAHPGHGIDGTVGSLLHWLSSPDHVVVIITVVGAMGVAARIRSRSVSKGAS
jgi:hydrogenase/urease accessory protein HupE